MSADSRFRNSRKEKPSRKQQLFEATVLPYLNSAFNLARWLTRNEQDAEDVVQESFLRALRSFDTFIVGRDARAWVLAIVRNVCRSWYRQNRSFEMAVELSNAAEPAAGESTDPEAILISNLNAEVVREALEQLPLDYREVLILRELEELSYREIAQIIDIPMGTVMSRLSRGRKELHLRLYQMMEDRTS